MFITVNNINICYTVKGKGSPLILLHGNGGNKEYFSSLISKLSFDYQVYALDSRCHGESSNSSTLSYELMRDDVIAFIEHLNIKNPILYGFSDGGIIGLMIAIKKPKLLSKLFVSGVNLNPKGFTFLMRSYVNIGYFLTQNKLFKLMRDEPNIEVTSLQKINIPTILFVGSFDIVSFSHTKLIKANIKNSTLKVIPHATHSSYVKNSKIMYSLLKKYL